MSESGFIDPTTPEGQRYWQRRHNAELAHEQATMLSPYDTIAAKLDAALGSFAYVAQWANLDREERESLSTGMRIVRELVTALKS